MSHRLLIALAIVSLAIALPSPALASGGSYTEWLCFNSTNGKATGASPELSLQTSGVPLAMNQDCEGTAGPSKGVQLVTGLPQHTADGNNAGIAWTAPPGVTITALQWWRAFLSPGNSAHFTITQNGTSSSQVYPPPDTVGEFLGWYGTNGTDGTLTNRGAFDSPFGSANGPVAQKVSGDGRAWYQAWMCDSAGNGGCDVASGSLSFRIFSAKLSLRDETSPLIQGTAGGTLATANPIRGQQTVSFNATDTGSGVYRALLLVDNTTISSQVVDDNAGRCADVNPANSDPYEFGRAVPCKTSVSGTFNLDTSSVPDGAHRVQVLVEDAAGNRAIALDRTLTVDNQSNGIGPGDDTSLRGAENGQPAADVAALRMSWSTKKWRTIRVARYGSTNYVGGTLSTADGRPIAGAQLDVKRRVHAAGRVSGPVPGVTTDAAGHFAIKLEPGVSRDLRVTYRSHLNDTIGIATATATLKIRAGLRFQVTPRHAHRFSKLRFRGQLRGGHIPAGGKQIQLQVRVGKRGRWHRFDVVRTGRSGRFSSRYPLTGSGSANYYFRAVSAYEAAYAFSTGRSRSLLVRKR
jgi:hypothetical protein